jgi:hypothetical protein
MQKLTNSYIYTEWIEKNIILFLAVVAGAAVLIKRRKK